jgi:hypothetical protein
MFPGTSSPQKVIRAIRTIVRQYRNVHIPQFLIIDAEGFNLLYRVVICLISG